MSWNYRIIRNHKGDEWWLGLHEVYYDDAGRAWGVTQEPEIVGDDVEELRRVLVMMLYDTFRNPEPMNFDDIPEPGAKNPAPSDEEIAAACKLTTSFPNAFLQAFAAFPKREGGNPKNRAFKAWKARRAQGISEADLLQSVLNYASYVRAKGKEGSEYVKQAATFFGPDWQLEWKTSEAVRRPGEFVGE